MFFSFFAQAAQSPGRQSAFRQVVWIHLLLLAAATWVLRNQDNALEGRAEHAPFLGHFLLVVGIVEGAMLIGWRLTQLPKSQALEFLLVTPLRPRRVFLAEALVGISRLALVTLAGLPVLLLLFPDGYLEWVDIAPLLVVPLTWGIITGLGLTAWAYEPFRIRRWSERLVLIGIALYLAIGVFVGEHLRTVLYGFKGRTWLPDGGLASDWLWQPEDLARWFLIVFTAFHRYNPFTVMEYWLSPLTLRKGEFVVAVDRMIGLELAALAIVVLLLLRASGRLKGHFHDRHYRPVVDDSKKDRGAIGNKPLSWWAVRRVTEYSGRVNLWLAAGFGGLFALYTVAHSYWPPWLGRQVFVIFEERLGGVPGLTTALVVLAAVPAAFQYGLWDSNAQDRCRRLELLLMSRLDPQDYWSAAAAAAWRRGRGYFAVALVLWIAAALGGKAALVQVAAACTAGVILWGLYFALGFRAFSRGMHANRLGLALTLGLPLLTYGCFRASWPELAVVLPPGSVYGPAAGAPVYQWLAGPILGGLIALAYTRMALARCDAELRRWYDLHHGQKVMD
jgi:hypothetical protein